MVSPATASVGINGVASFTLAGLDANGRHVPISGVQWFTLDGSIVAIDAGSVATGLAPGTGRIVARLGALADTASVSVVAIVDLSGRFSSQGVSLFPRGLNRAGVIVGDRSPFTEPGSTPFVMGPDWQAVQLPLPAGEIRGHAFGISESGVIVGGAGDVFDEPQAILWSAGSGSAHTITVLPPVATGAGGFGYAISPSGDFVAGVVYVRLAPNSIGAYPGRWTRGEDGSWSGERIPMPEGLFGGAFGVNDNGDVVGTFVRSAIEFQAALWHKENGVWVTESLGELGDDGTGAQAINAAGTVAGLWNGSAVVWVRTGSLWDQRKIFSPQDGVERSFASGINDAGVVVGAFTTGSAQQVQQAFRWTEGLGVEQLQSLATAGAARAINSRGQVVGVSYDPAGPRRLGTLWPSP